LAVIAILKADFLVGFGPFLVVVYLGLTRGFARFARPDQR
jgi:hypothetical protein